MLESYCERAMLANGMDFLDLGCGRKFMFFFCVELQLMSVLLKDGAACVCSLPKFVTWMLWLCGI
jgi:hypothetical protein